MSFDFSASSNAATSHEAFSQPAYGSSSSRNHHVREAVPNHRLKVSGKFSSGNTKPRAFVLTQSEWRKLSQRAFREHTHGKAKPAQVLADECECSPKTAQSWLDGDSTPAGLLDKRAFARIPAYNALVREITAMEADLDPRLQAKYQELHRLTLELANGGT